MDSSLAFAPSASECAFWHQRPVFVTGATGLLGSWLVRRLYAAGADVVCLMRDWVPRSELVRSWLFAHVKVVQGEVENLPLLSRALAEYEIDTVFHLAAQTTVGVALRHPIGTFETNIRGTWNVLEACRLQPRVRQIVVASSDKAYGTTAELPYAEEAPLVGRYPYDVSKTVTDLLAQSYAQSYGLPVTITRCGNFYGGGDLNFNRIVPGTIRSLLQNERPIVRSDGQYIRDYFYIEDGAAAYMTLAEALASDRRLIGEAFNFSNETPVSVLDLVDRLRAATGVFLEPEIRNEASNEIREQVLSARKAHERLGWHAAFSLEDGLARTIKWYRDYLEVA